VKSRNVWRSKAVERGEELCGHRKTDRRHRHCIAELKLEIERLKQILNADAKKKLSRSQRRPVESLNSTEPMKPDQFVFY